MDAHVGLFQTDLDATGQAKRLRIRVVGVNTKNGFGKLKSRLKIRGRFRGPARRPAPP
jgi:hypothetical protein